MGSKKLEYIDALRGWAVLLVISSHVSGPLLELPYPARKLANFGWYGVQLFFLASAITLLISWRADGRAFLAKVPEFFVRRFFRIAPLYYLGAIFYFFIDPPALGFDPWQLVRSLAFVNAWHPEWVPTTQGWMVVPGGWSISVEFSFYFLFPVLAIAFRGLWSSLVFLVFSLFAAVFVNNLVAPGLSLSHGETPANNFLYFWLVNQLPVFALGFVAYAVLISNALPQLRAKASFMFALSVGVLMLAIAEFYDAPKHYFHSLVAMPTMFWASLSFMLLIYLLSHGAVPWLMGRWIRRLGELSFSMYLLHFAVLHAAGPWLLQWWGHVPEGLEAIGAYVVLWCAVVMVTAGLSTLTYRWIETPGMRVGRQLIQRLRARREVSGAVPLS